MNCYKKLCTEFYDIDKPTVPSDAFEFYLPYARACDGPVLEPMCGSGRFLIPMMQAGIDIDGVDASADMLAACRARAARLALEVTVFEQLLHEMDLPRRYGLAFIPAGSFGLLEREPAREFLRRLHAALLPGGTLVFEIDQHRPSESFGTTWGGRWITRPDGAKIVISWLTHHDASKRETRSLHRYELIKYGRLLETEFEDFGGPAYDRAEVEQMLTEAGFGDFRYWKIYGMTPPDENDSEIIVECTRR